MYEERYLVREVLHGRLERSQGRRSKSHVRGGNPLTRFTAFLTRHGMEAQCTAQHGSARSIVRRPSFLSFPFLRGIFCPQCPVRNCFTLRLHLEERCAPDRQLFFILSCPLQGRARRKIEQQTVGCSVFDTLARLRVLYLSLFHKVEVFQRYVRNCRLSVFPRCARVFANFEGVLISFLLSLSLCHAAIPYKGLSQMAILFLRPSFPPLW